MTRRRKKNAIKRHYWGPIIGVVVIAIIFLVPSEDVRESIEGAKENIGLIGQLVRSLTDLTKAMQALAVAAIALVFYIVTKRRG